MSRDPAAPAAGWHPVLPGSALSGVLRSAITLVRGRITVRNAGAVMIDRHLDWADCFNVRDLGGLVTPDGRAVRRGALVRSDGINRLTAAGWAALSDYGVRTIVDLRNDEEIEPDAAPRPPGVVTVRVPLDDRADTTFWQWCGANELDGSPLYYGPFLDQKPERCAAAITAVARAGPGGVLVHCVGGRDRTGLISMLLLALAGVSAEDIAADYELSTERLHGLYAAWDAEDQGPGIQQALASKGTTVRDALLTTLAGLDVAAYLRSAGVPDADLASVRDRLLEPAD
jgi:protein-tyrosine phosphatase